MAYERYFEGALRDFKWFVQASEGVEYACTAFKESFDVTYRHACEQAPAVAEKYREFAESIDLFV